MKAFLLTVIGILNGLDACSTCYPTTYINVTNIGSTQVTCSWNAVAGALSYSAVYRVSGTTTWLSQGYIGLNTSQTLTGLTPGTQYDYGVQCQCAALQVSTLTTTMFTTLVACNPPSGLTTNMIGATQATIIWLPVVGALSYQLEYKTLSASMWTITGTSLSSTNFTLTGLLPSTTYVYRIRANCSGGSITTYSQQQFTTLTPTCNPPSFPLATNITAHTATIQWTAASGGNSYTIEYKPISSSLWSIQQTSLTTIALSGLNSSTQYDFRIKTNCTSLSSNYVSGQFTTLVSCGIPGSLNATSISSVGATLQWSAISGATNYEVQYRQVVGGIIAWNSVNSITNSLTITGLQASTSYEWQVNAFCSGGILSGYSSTAYFTTQACVTPIGSSMLNPISAGNITCSGNSFTHTIINSPSNCFSNNLNSIDNQPSPDVWYQFTVNSTITIEVSHCAVLSNNMNTYLHLLDHNGNQLLSNDDNGPACTGIKASLQLILVPGTYYVVSEGSGNEIGSITTTLQAIPNCSTDLHLKLYVESYMSGTHTMYAVMNNQGYTGLPAVMPNDVDDITIELRETAYPYLVQAFTTTRLKTNGDAFCTFAPINGYFYIVVKHRNAIETWSKIPQWFSSGQHTYDFSISDTQAFGNNQVQVSPGIWAFYSGDIDQNDNIDLIDLSILEYDINTFQYGYVSTDINGDGNVDLLDIPHIEQNINQFIFAHYP